MFRRVFRLPLRTRKQVADDASDELRSVLAERVDYLMARGASREAAQREALQHLGLPLDQATALLHTSATERERAMRFRQTIEELSQDLRYAARTLRKNAGFTSFATLIVGLGVAASVTVFSVASALLIRPLPFRDPGSLVWIANADAEAGLSSQTIQVKYVLDSRAESKSLSSLAAYMAFYQVGDSKLTIGTEATRVTAVPVSQNFFPLLGVQPEIGRGFTSDEAAWQGPKAVLLSHAFWRRQFLGDSSVVGAQVRINGDQFRVIGVLPRAFDFGAVFAPGTRVELFTAFPLTAETDRWGNTSAVIGRLRPGVTLAQANTELQILGKRLTAKYPGGNEFTPHVTNLSDHVTGSFRSALSLLAFAVGVVMLIVCANLSSLLLARATSREQEIAVRIALGAGRGRLVRQMLTESLLLSTAGAVVGLLLAVVATDAIAKMDAVSLPLLTSVRVDPAAIGFALILAIGCGIAFGLAPAVQVPTSAVHESLRSAGRSNTGSMRGQRMRRALVVSEIALACVLFVASGLLIRSFLKVLDVDLGFRPHNVAAIRVDPDATLRRDEATLIGYMDNVLRLAATVPGVQSVGLGDGIPLGGNRSWGSRAADAPNTRESWQTTFVRLMSDGYIDAMGMRLVAGRDFAPTDGPKTDKVIIINEALAQRFWPGQSAIGKMMVTDTVRRVVGVVADVRNLGLESAPGFQMYLPLRQSADFSSVHLVIRASVPPASLANALRKALAPVTPNLPVNGMRTLPQVVDKATSPRRFFTTLLGGFATFALGLALLGIYSVISYAVSMRTQEIGVRMALGASPGEIRSRVIGDTLGLAVRGLILGTVGAWAVARMLSGFLFGVEVTDGLTFVSMVIIVTLVAAISGYLPARRAARIDPIRAMRAS